MKTRKNWLFKDVRNVIAVCGAQFLTCCLFIAITRVLGVGGNHFLFKKGADSFREFLYECIFAPCVEEFLFRWLPITFFAVILSSKVFGKWKWFIAAFTSIFFGVCHSGYWSIFFQGLGGFFFCYLYFKNRFGYISGVVAHFLWNFSLGFVLPSVGRFEDAPLFPWM